MDEYAFPFAWRGLTLNAHRTAAGQLDPAASKLSDTIRVDRWDFSKLQQRDQREALHLRTGGDLGDATIAFRYLALSGAIVASTGAKLDDRTAELMALFDVEECQRASPSTEGVLPFDFTGLTDVNNGRGTAWADPVTGAAAGFYVPERFYARPAAVPVITARRSSGTVAPFGIELVCADPRRYCQVAEAVVLNAANTFIANCPNWNALQGKAVPPVATIALTAAGHASFILNLPDATPSLVLNLSGIGAGAHSVIVDFGTGVISLDGTERADLRTSVVGSLDAVLPAGGGSASASNTTNVTSVTIAYRQARG